MHQITLTVSQNVLVSHINEHSCVHSVHHQHAHVISGGHASIDDVPVKVKTSLHRVFLQVVDVMNLCFMYALLYNTHFDKAMIHLMQVSLLISRCNATYLVF